MRMEKIALLALPCLPGPSWAIIEIIALSAIQLGNDCLGALVTSCIIIGCIIPWDESQLKSIFRHLDSTDGILKNMHCILYFVLTTHFCKMTEPRTNRDRGLKKYCTCCCGLLCRWCLVRLHSARAWIGRGFHQSRALLRR